MMFRERRGKLNQWVLCIRTRYDSESKRGVQKVVAKFDWYAGKLPSDVVEKLTPEERSAAEEWIAARDRKMKTSTVRHVWQDFVRSADNFSSSLEDAELAPMAVERINAAELFGALDRLTKALRKAGVAKPQAPKRNAEPGQPTPLENAIAAASGGGTEKEVN